MQYYTYMEKKLKTKCGTYLGIKDLISFDFFLLLFKLDMKILFLCWISFHFLIYFLVFSLLFHLFDKHKGLFLFQFTITN